MDNLKFVNSEYMFVIHRYISQGVPKIPPQGKVPTNEYTVNSTSILPIYFKEHKLYHCINFYLWPIYKGHHTRET